MEALTICDSIACKILSENIVLAGVGNELRVFSGTCDSVVTLGWKLKNKIHGIDVNNSRILVWGEREFMVLEHKNNEFHFVSKAKISDWISCGRLLNDTADGICLVTGHSVAIYLTIVCTSDQLSLNKRSSCSDKSTIYCSTIIGRSSEDCMIFAGTAFGELIIWKPDLSDLSAKNVDHHQPVLHRIVGHNGSIFSIDISITHKLITTTSDDRSVRFYSFGHLDINTEPIDWATVEITPLRNVFGHNARVFKAKIIENDGKPYVISVGEDSFISIWNTNGDLIFKRRHHFGATIWDFDYSSQLKTLFSTSSDGNLISYNLGDHFKPNQVDEMKTISLREGEYFAKIKFLKRNFTVGVTNNNRLFCRFSEDWKIVENFSGYKCTLLEVFGDLVAIAGFKVLTLFKLNDVIGLTKVFEKPVVSGVIRSFCFLSDSEALVCDERGECKYSLDNFENSVSIEIPVSKERWITSAMKYDQFLVLSNRQGHLFLYTFENNGFSLKTTLKHIHGHLGVTHMSFRKDYGGHFLMRTAGHDSTIKTLKIVKKFYTVAIVLTECIPVAWVEKFYELPSRGDHIVGFNDNHFVMWASKQDVVFQVPCGGGHRCWDLLIDEPNNFVQMLFIKNRLVFTMTAKLDLNISNTFRPPYSSWHIKLCSTVESFPLSGRCVLLVSGGEDNLLKFSKLSLEKSPNLQLIQNIHLHVSSIKGIAIVEKEKMLTIFSVGGRAQICITEFNLNTEIVEERSQFMLKSTDLARKYQRNTQEVDFDPETRFMSIAVVDCGEYYDLYLGCSDGYIRKFSYRSGNIELQDALFYNRCILYVKEVHLNSKIFLASVATDGWICFWTLDTFCASSVPMFKVRHHESGINSFDLCLGADKTLLVVTGGDDQNVALSKIYASGSDFVVQFTKHFNIHTAQVNGVRFSNCKKYFYTTSIDQNICRVNLANLELDDMVTSCVADAKGLDIFSVGERSYCVKYGWGVQVFKL